MFDVKGDLARTQTSVHNKILKTASAFCLLADLHKGFNCDIWFIDVIKIVLYFKYFILVRSKSNKGKDGLMSQVMVLTISSWLFAKVHFKLLTPKKIHTRPPEQMAASLPAHV